MLSPRHLAIVLVSGLVAATAVIGLGAFLTRREFETDGSFELTEPGVFVEPRVAGTAAPVPEPDRNPGAGVDDVLSVAGLVDADDRPVDLEIYRGGPLVINVWFSTCAPCERELRDFGEVHDEFGDRVAFVGVNPFDGPDVMNDFAVNRGVGYDLARDPELVFVTALGISAYPTTLLVSPEGEVLERLGVIDADRLRQRLAEHFGV